MKKALFLVLALAFGGKHLIAQDGGENDLKNFRFGLKTTGALTWYAPDDKKKFESGGVSAKGGYGLMMEFRLNKVAVLATGLQVDYDGGKLNFGGTTKDTSFYYLSDGALLSNKDTAGKDYTAYALNSRQYNTTYVTIPLTLKLKTNEIGYLTYYGQFGLNASFRLKNRTDDAVSLTTVSSTQPYLSAANGTASQNDIDNTKDMQLFKFALNIGGGAEWNLSGSTSLVFGLNWYNGFSNVLKSDSKYLFRTFSHDFNPTEQKARANAIALSVGILF